MTGKAKLSSKNQIVIPKNIRQYVNLKPGDELLIEGLDGKIILLKKPKNYTDSLAGMHSNVWEGTDPLKYIGSIRKGWGRRKKK
ncbi:MAG: AbrB/MazE/SpoVT family DNA-binding domain-containing protein [Candidatus Margulisbacteria bacterium]|nr:AbrB/MazE/SpoVT family DNA-binding domain-containing protein [Candidatus Margulisiibacteriota bacterium]